MNVWTFYQTKMFTACLKPLISYTHTEHYVRVDVLPEDTLV